MRAVRGKLKRSDCRTVASTHGRGSRSGGGDGGGAATAATRSSGAAGAALAASASASAAGASSATISASAAAVLAVVSGAAPVAPLLESSLLFAPLASLLERERLVALCLSDVLGEPGQDEGAVLVDAGAGERVEVLIVGAPWVARDCGLDLHEVAGEDLDAHDGRQVQLVDLLEGLQGL